MSKYSDPPRLDGHAQPGLANGEERSDSTPVEVEKWRPGLRIIATCAYRSLSEQQGQAKAITAATTEQSTRCQKEHDDEVDGPDSIRK
jgi:hypothetical protein